ncbi:MAG TPA: hypothetical protein VFL36_05505 [Myxococcales bacterium]|nr:hypothetical protein [Myxococcales bacterium]
MKAPRRLFEVLPAEFTAARNALARELRDAGKAGEANEVAALRRPAATLWIANQLGPRHRREVEALIAATRKLEKAQAGAGGDLREAMQEQRSALQGTMEKVDALAREVGAHVTPELQRRVQTTVTSAAASDPDGLLEGTLAHELEATGFSELLGKGPAARTLVPEPRGAQVEKAGARSDDKAAKAAEKRAEAAARRARAGHDRALKRAEAEAMRLDHRARALEKKAARAQAAAEDAGRAATQARERANAAAAQALHLRQQPSGR